jgi:hypothetical protein
MLRDLRYAARMLVRTPAFTTIAILTLALGIGLASTIFSAVNALLIKPLPLMKDQQRLVVLEHYLKNLNEKENAGFDYPGFLDARKQLTTIERIGALENTTMIISGSGKPGSFDMPVGVQWISPSASAIAAGRFFPINWMYATRAVAPSASGKTDRSPSEPVWHFDSTRPAGGNEADPCEARQDDAPCGKSRN